MDDGGTTPFLASTATAGAYNAGTSLTVDSSPLLAATDIDGDNLDDVAFGTAGGLKIFFNKAATPGTLDTTALVGSGLVRNAAFGVFAGNAPRKDILIKTASPTAALFTQDASRSFTQTPAAIGQLTGDVNPNGGGSPFVTVDLNSDGRQDVAGDGTMALQCGNPGTFSPGDGDPPLTYGEMTAGKGSPAFGDLDGNGKADFVQAADQNLKVFFQ